MSFTPFQASPFLRTLHPANSTLLIIAPPPSCDTQYVGWPELQDISADLNNLCGKAEVRAQEGGKGKGSLGVRKGMACYLRTYLTTSSYIIS